MKATVKKSLGALTKLIASQSRMSESRNSPMIETTCGRSRARKTAIGESCSVA
jgi:hypothetical protein